MKIKALFTLALAGFALVSHAAQTFTEDFSHDPALDGWKTFGNTNLFTWDSVNHNLKVTWDSSQSNSYFYHPLGTIMSRADDFSMSFDLLLNDYAIGVDPSYPDTFELAAGFQNFAEATSTNFFRAGYPSQPDLVEFDFFQWDNDFSTNTIDPTFVDSTNGFFFPGASIQRVVELPTNIVMRVTCNYTAADQVAIFSITTNGAPLCDPLTLTLTDTNSFGTFADFRVDTFAVESYSQAMGYGSLLAHGTVANILITAPPPPVNNIAGVFTNGTWQVQLSSRTNWNYILENSADLATWSPVTTNTGTGGNLFLQDTNTVQPHQFYRINAQRAP